MMVTFAQHAGSEDSNGAAVITYMIATSALKRLPSGVRVTEQRDPAPEILKGSPDLVRRMIASLNYKCRYSMGVLSFAPEDIDIARFNAGDPELRRIVGALIDDFEDTIFAGIPARFRPPLLWTTHTHVGRLELNFLVPRAVMTGRPDARHRQAAQADPEGGAIRSFNPHPPGKASRALMDAFRDRWNCLQGWADPEDPGRRQALKLPDHVVKRRRNATRLGRAEPGKLPAEQLHDLVCDWIRDGTVSDRATLVRRLEHLDYGVARQGGDYLTLISAGPHPPGFPRFPKRTRLHGALWSRSFVNREAVTGLLLTGRRRTASPRLDRRAVQARLDRLRAERTRFHHARFGGPAWRDDEVFFGPMDAPDEAARRLDAPGFASEPETCRIGPDLDRATATKLRIWQSLYPVDLPAGLARELAYVDAVSRTVRLKDGSRLVDHGDALTASASTDPAVGLMALEAKGKGWTHCRVSGDAKFLRKITRACAALEIRVRATTPEMQFIIDEEYGRLGLPQDAEPARDKTEPASAGAAEPRASDPARTDDRPGDENPELPRAPDGASMAPSGGPRW